MKAVFISKIDFTKTQKQRLLELNASEAVCERDFENMAERDEAFQGLEKGMVNKNREDLFRLREGRRQLPLCELEAKLAGALTSAGFVQVITPIILSKGHLEKMSIRSWHPLSRQIFWLGEKKCLRPMLAPHLYILMRNLLRLWGRPVRIFEVGPCFRRESKGNQHLEEFTMLNLVELGLPEEQRGERLEELARLVMHSAGIDVYQLARTSSEVYGETLDVLNGSNELGSCAMGPHPLDEAWGIMDPWVGLGFGLERLIVMREGYQNIRRAGRSLVYLGGAKLNI
jgi:pyrrolysyl-tRNA synthetase-like protein